MLTPSNCPFDLMTLAWPLNSPTFLQKLSVFNFHIWVFNFGRWHKFKFGIGIPESECDISIPLFGLVRGMNWINVKSLALPCCHILYNINVDWSMLAAIKSFIIVHSICQTLSNTDYTVMYHLPSMCLHAISDAKVKGETYITFPHIQIMFAISIHCKLPREGDTKVPS